MPTHPTMADVAREAGVSLMTVSRVINHKEGVHPNTRQHIQEIIRRLDYRPSGIARGLATHRTGTLGLVVPDISNPFFAGVAHGVEQVAYAEGYSVLLCNTEEDPQRELRVLTLLEEKRVDGVVLCSSRLPSKKLCQVLKPHGAVVLVNRKLQDQSNTNIIGTVIIDDRSGGKAATQHLICSGHRIIGYLSGPPYSFSGRSRMRGYKTALSAAGIPFESKLTLPCQPTVAGGYSAARQLIGENPEMTALFCYNDLVAVGALRACAELGRRVPADLAVVGYDDIFLADLVTPSLTTCRVSRTELGQSSTRLLLDRLRDCHEGCQNIVLEAELVLRSSAP